MSVNVDCYQDECDYDEPIAISKLKLQAIRDEREIAHNERIRNDLIYELQKLKKRVETLEDQLIKEREIIKKELNKE